MLTVAQLMTHHADRVAAGDSIAAAAALMADSGISSVLVVDDGQLLGIVTERDLLLGLHRRIDPQHAVTRIMNIAVVTVSSDMVYTDAYRSIRQNGIRHLVVLDRNQLPAGVVSETDFRRHLGQDFFSQYDNAGSFIETRFLRLPPSTPLKIAIDAMADDPECSVLVHDGDAPLGVFAEHDIPHQIHRGSLDLTLGEALRAECPKVAQHVPLALAARTMLEHRVRSLLVVDEQESVLGLLTERSMMQTLERCLLDYPSALLTRLPEAEKIISRNERYQRALLDNFPYLVWLKDTDSRFLAVNQPLADALGEAGTDTLIGRDDYDYSPKDLAERYQADDRTVMASGQKMVVTEEISLRGVRTWHETYKAPVFDTDGHPLGTVGFARNISAQQRTEEATLVRNAALAGLLRGERLENLLELIALSAETELPGVVCAIMLATPDGRHLRLGAAPSLPEASQASLARIAIADETGISGTAAYRKARVICDDLLNDPCGKDFQAFSRSAGIVSGWAEPILAKDGIVLGTFAAYNREVRIPVPEEAELLRLASQLAALVISHSRTTERLSASLSTFQGIFDTISEAIFIVDRRGRLIDLNAQAQRLSGYGLNTLAKKTFRHLLAPGFNTEDGLGKQIAVTLGGTPQTAEAWGLSAAGRVFPVEIHMRPGRHFGREVVIASVQEISERRSTEERLRIERDLAEALANGLSKEAFNRLLITIGIRFPEFDSACVHELAPDGSYRLVDHQGLTPEFLATALVFAPDSPQAIRIQSGRVGCSCGACESACADHDMVTQAAFKTEGLLSLAILPIVTSGRATACLFLASHHTALITPGTLLALQTLGSRYALALTRLNAEAEASRLGQDLVGLFEAMNDLLFIISPQGTILHCNRAISDLLGYTPETLQGSSFSALTPPEFRELAVEIGHAIAAGLRKTSQLPLLRADGSSFTAEARAFRGHWKGQPAILCIAQDISERLLSEERQKLAASVFDNAHEGIVITDHHARIVDVNETFTELTGYARQEAIGQTPSMLKSGHHSAEFYNAMWQNIQQDGYWRGEVWNRKKSGEIYVERLTISAIRDRLGNISHYVGIFSDITLIKEHEQRLERLAHYDALTQLPNRMLLGDRLELAMSQAERSGKILAVSYLDLDGFKPVNDRFGHAVGDRLLVEVAKRLKSCVRGGDTVARLGGDEFVLLLSSLENEQECDQAILRLMSSLTQPFNVDSHAINISASIGVTLYPQDAADADSLLRHADQAMYAAKQAGRNRHHLFDPENDRLARIRRTRINDIRQALVNGEFRLFYQPKINMRQGIVVGAEALIRWPQADGSVLLPGSFLPLIDGSELEIELGNWVIREALDQMEAWSRQGLQLQVSVNIAGEHLQHPDFTRRLAEMLAARPTLDPSQLELEILETTALDDIAQVTEIFSACRQLGVRFALDDFGTGYSSLTYFKRLPADVLKIDRSFVCDMLDDPEDQAIVEGVIGLTRAFQRSVIAEGVETAESAIALLLLGCDLAQGFGLSRPMPAESLPAWIVSFRPDKLWQTVNAKPCPRDHLPLLIAEAGHKRWVNGLIAYFDEHSPHVPELSPENCRFGQWYESEQRPRYRQHPIFQQVDHVHRQLHELAGSLIRQKQASDDPHMPDLRREFLEVSEELSLLIRQLLNSA